MYGGPKGCQCARSNELQGDSRAEVRCNGAVPTEPQVKSPVKKGRSMIVAARLKVEVASIRTSTPPKYNSQSVERICGAFRGL